MSKPYHAPWSKHRGSEYIEEWQEEVSSGSVKGVRTIIRYKCPKGKIRECTAWVKWLN